MILSDDQIDVLHRSGRAVFVQKNSASLQLGIGLVVGILQGVAGADIAQVNGADAFFTEGKKLVLAVFVF